MTLDQSTPRPQDKPKEALEDFFFSSSALFVYGSIIQFVWGNYISIYIDVKRQIDHMLR